MRTVSQPKLGPAFVSGLIFSATNILLVCWSALAMIFIATLLARVPIRRRCSRLFALDLQHYRRLRLRYRFGLGSANSYIRCIGFLDLDSAKNVEMK